MILKIIFYSVGSLLIVATLLPFIRKDHWTFRVFEFPRLQKFFLALGVLVLGATIFYSSPFFYGFMTAEVGISVYLAYLIFPFTPLAKKALAGTRSSSGPITILISNVFQDNKKFQKLKAHISTFEPDIILLLETDKKWQEALKECTDPYPFRLEYPQENTYGLLFYSKLELVDPEIRFLISKEYPSIKARLKLADGVETLFYGLHPPPPSPTEKTYSTERDHELWMIAKEVQGKDDLVIVAGDLNDVAWSYTTDRFLDISNLRDPRKGRGIFATFHAKNLLFRWPLDHIFCSEHFKLVKMKRLKSINSDHFPVLVKLAPPSGSRQR